jgi:replicative DNA helicase
MLDTNKTALPSKVDTERDVISTILCFPKVGRIFLTELKPEHFYNDLNKLIFEKCVELDRDGYPVTVKTVCSDLTVEQLKIVNRDYLDIVKNNPPVPGEPEVYIKKLKEAFTLRETCKSANALMKEAEKPDGSIERISKMSVTLTKRIEETELQEGGLIPLAPDDTLVTERVFIRPPDPDYIINFKKKGFISRGIVASIAAAGGTGKTQLLTQICIACARGSSFAYFAAPKPLKVLFLVAEETQDDLDRKIWDSCNGRIPQNIYAYSIKGIIPPLMELDGNKPVRTAAWTWLDRTISNHNDLDLLVLDPKSRLYGLDENNNDHNTQWVACLETLSVKYSLSIWFSCHTPKGIKEINQWMARGGGALIDACRSNMGMVKLDSKEAKKYEVNNWRNYLKIGISKINIGPEDSGDAYLKFDDRGVLHPVVLYNERIHNFRLCNELT